MIFEKQPQKNLKNQADSFPNKLYHYTNFSALKSIFQNYELWMTDITQTNDRKEIIHHIQRFKQALKSYSKSPYYSEFFKKVNDYINNHLAFAFCLSKNFDDAAQWARYAQNGQGVCIVFNKNILEFRNNKLLFVNPVFYEFNIKETQYYDILKTYFESGELTGGFDSIDNLVSNFCIKSCLFKHPSFKIENEIRITNSLLNGGNISEEIIGNRLKRISKIKLSKEEFTDCIEEIIIGPCATIKKSEINKIINLNDFPNLKIKKSKCPLR